MGRDADPIGSAERTGEALTSRLGHHETVVIAGSGWADAARSLGSTGAELPLSELPGVDRFDVMGHQGLARSARVARPDGPGADVLVLAGRVHLYEGHPVDRVVHLVRAAVLSGCTRVVLTNAAGSLRADSGVGSVVVISDQLNLTGQDPLRGPDPGPGFPSRFVDLSDLYDRRLRNEIARRRPELVEGVYAGLPGSSFETPAEIRMLRTLGADLVGMSTVLESIAAHHLGAEVIGLSLVTNLAAGLQDRVDHREVLDVGRLATPGLTSLLTDVVAIPGG